MNNLHRGFRKGAGPSPSAVSSIPRLRRAALLALGATLGLALATPSAAVAQRDGAHLEITPQFGYRAEGVVETTYRDILSDDAEVRDGDVLGLTVGIPVTRGFQIEFLARQQDTELFQDGGLFAPERSLGDIEIGHYHVGALWQWGSGQVMPFVVGSLGLARLDLDLAGADTEERVSASIGGGVKVYFGDNVGLRFEGRGFWTNLDKSDRGCDRDRRGFCCDRDDDCFDYNDDDGIYQSEATIGLILRF